jgi:hypothetical protein
MATPKIQIASVKPAYFYSTKDRRTNARGGAGSKRSSLDLSGVTGKKSSGGKGGGDAPAGPSSRETGKMVDSGAASDMEGTPLMEPELETQEPLENLSRKPSFSVGNSAHGNIDLGSILSERTNKGYDSTKPIGGENVPYKPTEGLFGAFRRAFGDQANEKNQMAQAQQGAQWRDAAELKAAQAREDALETTKFNNQLALSTGEQEAARQRAETQATVERERMDADQRRWAATQTSLIDERERDEIAKNLARKQTQDIADRAYDLQKKGYDLQEGKFNLDKSNIEADNTRQANEIKYSTDKDGNSFASKGGKLYQYTKPVPPMGKIPGRKGGWALVDLENSGGGGFPSAGSGEAQVDPATGKPLTGKTGASSIARPASFAGGAAGAAGAASMGEVELPPEESAPAQQLPEPPYGPPQLMDHYNMRTKQLMESGPGQPSASATYPLTGPLYRNMAQAVGAEPEQVGASRFSTTPGRTVENNLDRYMAEFGKLPNTTQEQVVNDALLESYRNPKLRRPAFDWQYK